MKKRVFSLLLALVMLFSAVPMTAFAAHDSTGKPLDLNNGVCLALYVSGNGTFPGEPSTHPASNYITLNSDFSASSGSVTFKNTAQGFLKEEILDDVVQGTNRVWGVFSTSGGSRYLDPASGLVNADGKHNSETEEKILKAAESLGHFSLNEGEKYSDYTIVWYIVKYQADDQMWHIDGVITKKATFSVNYYGNGNTQGQAPNGVSDIQPGSMYTVAGNIGNLQRKVGNDTYFFDGWNTQVDGTGTHYEPGEQIQVNSDIALYAQWYLQNKYTITVVTKLDDRETNVSDIHGEELTFWVKEKNSDDYLELTRTTTGTYTTTVTENGQYQVFRREADGTFHNAHGHEVIIYNQNGRTELLNYSVTYDANAGDDTVTWTEGAAPVQQNYHATESMFATTNQPVRTGYTFLYWQDQNGNIIYPDRKITDSITEKTVLTAVWQENVDVTVNITVNHKANGALNPDKNKGKILFNLLEHVNGVDLPVESVGVDQLLGSDSVAWNYHYNEETGVSTYTYTFKNLPQGVYTAAATKSHYATTVTRSGDSNEDQIIDIQLTFEPDSFDLEFDVIVNYTQESRELMPVAVNVRVLWWNGQNWVVIGQQETGTAPVSVFVDENGRGHDYFPVWKHWDNGELYSYRVAVTSFVMPDGTVVPASGDGSVYTPNDSGLYTAVVTVENGGIVPTYPTQADLPGAVYDKDAQSEQNGIPTVTVDITPFTVTFVAEECTIEGQTTLVLTNQYQYPNLNKYVPEIIDHNLYFVGWYTADGEPAENKYLQYLTEDVVYYAKFQHGMTVKGTITLDATYEQDGKTIQVNESDRAKEVLVVLEKEVGDNLVAVQSEVVSISYDTKGVGTYCFEDIPNNGTQYRVRVMVKNYDTTYDNESDPEISFSETEYIAVLGDDEIAVVDAHLPFNPEKYIQYMEVDASRIGEGFRPTGVQSVILFRDLGDVHPYRVITQHTVEPYGVYIPLSAEAKGDGSYEVWKYHTDSTLYEYQMDITKVMGNVDGVFSPEGTVYNSDTAPFIIEYGLPSLFSTTNAGQMRTLKATLIPKEYDITFDLGLNPGEEVYGMEHYLSDSDNGEQYIYYHTWSESAEFDAYPYRPGYVFLGWECENTGVSISKGGHVFIAASLAEDLVLKAKWEKVEGISYFVRHLEMNTEKPLKGAVVVQEGVAVGSVVNAIEMVAEIKGYKFAGVMVDGKLYSVDEDVQMKVTENNANNVMTIYYLPDGSDGYTDQVESNLKLDKTATLEDNGTYTITMETYTKDNPVTTLIQQNTPLDIVLVLDQSGSLADNEKAGLVALQGAVDTFVEAIADHGRYNEVDHRIAVVGYASNQTDGTSSTNASNNPYSGGVVSSTWTNTGVFDSNGEFHLYNVTGFNYTKYTGSVEKDGIYYTQSADHNDAFLLLTYHKEYRHLITEEEARMAVLDGTTVYGYVYDDNDVGTFVALTRNTSGLWLYGDKKLYSQPEFFTYHTDVWTHRHGLEKREIHAYGTGSNYREVDGHAGIYKRTETTGSSYQLGVYEDALIPVSVGANGSGGVNPGLIKTTQGLGANGGTRASYGMEMANKIFAANPTTDRVRIVVMFTDGQPGQTGFLESEANAAIAEAYKTKHDYGAYVYTIGLYKSGGVDADSNIAYYMNALSSNYPDAKSMEDIKRPAGYVPAADGQTLDDGVTRYAKYGNNYYTLKYGRIYLNFSFTTCWYFANGNAWYENVRVSTETAPVITNGKVGDYEIYEYKTAGYKETEHTGYYSTTDSTSHLEEYFTNVMKEITTKITREIILHEDTILRDIMGQGLVLKPGSVITAYKVAGTYNVQTEDVDWASTKEKVAQVTIPESFTGTVFASSETTTIDHYQADGTVIQEMNVPYIQVYNLKAENATDPDAPNYHPHTVDITGYDFENWYISKKHTQGYKMVVEITKIEATDDVQWGRSTPTNHPDSGLWLPKDEKGERQLLLPFQQPTTIFVERAYVLDYGKQFTLSGWYFDDEVAANGAVTEDAAAVHVDCNVENGMNLFETANKQNGKNNQFGNIKYGNVQVNDDGTVTYTPTSMSWGGYDQFMVFGDTWRKTVLAQDANQNGNLWNKVTVIPANNIYYEDSFITNSNDQQNCIEGFTFSNQWSVVTDGEVGKNEEIPEHLETAPYGDVHGWTDALANDIRFTDGSAHFVGGNKDNDRGATAEFTFTGTGVDVYTYTNINSGYVVAVLTSEGVDENGDPKTTTVKSLAMDNQSVSGGYYHIPTVSFDNLVYGTYTLKLIATSAMDSTTGKPRYEYYIDGARVYNPLGMTQNYASGVIKDAYGKENNAVYTEVRDILLQQGDFNPNLEDEEGGKQGAVFIDQIKQGQGSESDQPGLQYTYELATFKDYGPKNEVYLSSGQAIVIKVAKGNTYYMGLKSLTGETVKVNVSGITKAQPTTIQIAHTTDMYYEITPVDGYIVIQNGGDSGLVSITNLRTTNPNGPVQDGGVLLVEPIRVMRLMRTFSQRIEEANNPQQPEEEAQDPAQQQVEGMFQSVRTWLKEEEE